MARPQVRTQQLLLDEVNRIRELFGTAAQAHKHLGLDGEITIQELRRALAWQTVRPEHAELIQSRWRAWCHFFLKDPDTIGFTLPADLRI